MFLAPWDALRGPARAESNYLGHEPVGAGALLVLEDDVLVIVGHQILEPGVVASDAALGESAGGEGVLRDVGHMLLEDERREFAGPPSASHAPARAATHGAQDEGQQERCRSRPHLRTHAPSALLILHLS
jgi:hypothetical protein